MALGAFLNQSLIVPCGKAISRYLFCWHPQRKQNILLGSCISDEEAEGRELAHRSFLDRMTFHHRSEIH